jgi:calcineurin-like phosphoesterase family protein
MIYVIADPHLGDRKLIEKARHTFAKTSDEHSELFIKNWNKVVHPSDTVYVLGDLGRDKRIVEAVFKQLRGTKILILGNHDNSSKAFYESIFDKVYSHPIYLSARIVLSHIPIPVPEGVINIHGHTHWITLNTGRHFNVAFEQTSGIPVRITVFEKVIMNTPKENIKFCQEWYKDIQVTTNERMPHVILREDGTVDPEKTLEVIRLSKESILEDGE